MLTHGGMGYAKEYHVERYFRESLIPRIAPVSRELILQLPRRTRAGPAEILLIRRQDRWRGSNDKGPRFMPPQLFPSDKSPGVTACPYAKPSEVRARQ